MPKRSLVLLSHPLGPEAPLYPGLPPARFEPLRLISKGDVCNSYLLSFPNHAGTHVDAPAHFNPAGPKISELPIETFVYDHPALIDLSKKEKNLITAEEMGALKVAMQEADALLIRTGYGKVRKKNPEAYTTLNPALSPGAAEFIMDALPSVRAVLIDTISVGPAWDKQISLEVHRCLTGVGRSDGRFVLIVEDVNLAASPKHLGRVMALPLPLKNVDSAPCIVVAEGV